MSIKIALIDTHVSLHSELVLKGCNFISYPSLSAWLYLNPTGASFDRTGYMLDPSLLSLLPVLPSHSTHFITTRKNRQNWVDIRCSPLPPFLRSCDRLLHAMKRKLPPPPPQERSSETELRASCRVQTN